MKILITGATGFVGSKLLETLILKGYTDIRILSRNKSKAQIDVPFPVDVFEWNPEAGSIDKGALEGLDAIIHLAGESVAEGRWTEKKKKNILDSRILGTRLLLKKLAEVAHPPKKFISASAIGIYGDRGETSLNECSDFGQGFLADVCKQWEDAVLKNTIENMQSAVIRVGIVLGKNGGALSKMLPPFKAGVGGKLGSGDQYMSWIHLDDLVGQFIFLLEKEKIQGAYNGTSPRPVSNYIFTNILGRELNRPTLLPVPAFGLKLLFGEMSQILLGGQKVIPERFMHEGYEYKFRSLKEALRDILNLDMNGESELKKYQWVARHPNEVFPFFSNEKNLEKITPPFLKFKVLGKNTTELGEGTLIDYNLSLRGIPFSWQSRIEEYVEGQYFIDGQTKGPYTKWVHTHKFLPYKNGTLIEDSVIYKIPMGILGRLFAGPFIKGDLDKIFNYRSQIINKLFKSAA